MGAEKACFCIEETALPGVKRVADKVMADATLVTDVTFEKVTLIKNWGEEEFIVLIATLGHSNLLDNWEAEETIDFSDIRGKREVYRFSFLEIGRKKILLIAGSDKRGTIYGAFHLSELLGVSPWVYFADVMPKKKKEVVFTESVQMVSKEPSVKYRGIFINDEWPSFGNWTFEKFHGFTAEMYDHVFELILRLKGNYLWPAMWSSNFSCDGPGMASAILADEYGIVMSNSHHEPCLRHSEEWDDVKGEDTPYGTEWNFDRNKEGLKEYWKGGLQRNGKLENIITMGMRGERDSEILGHEAGLKENIQYLKDVLVTQNQLIRENVCEDLDKVPRMIALYKEVEAYYYGDENTPGLKGYEELDGVTLMLCEDNFGNMRYLPTKEERNHRGGYGMYYHFDYHGGPVSYEWVNSTCLSKVWEQMTTAYESGVSEIWVVNVGDLKPQELPISYFMDLAYDYEKWGINAINSTHEYVKQWVSGQFEVSFSAGEQEKIVGLIEDYTRINSIYKPEATNPETIHPLFDRKADEMLEKCHRMIETAEELLEKCKMKVRYEGGEILSDEKYASFYQLVYFPVVASMNLLSWNLYAGKNHYYAKLGAIVANEYAKEMDECNLRDEELKMIYHSIMNGKWNHMMSSEHVGFINWNDEDARLPVKYIVESKEKPRMIVSAADTEGYSIGTDWTNRHLYYYHFMDPKCDEICLSVANGTKKPFQYEIGCDAEWLNISKISGKVSTLEQIALTLKNCNRSTIPSENGIATATVEVKSSFAKVFVHIYVLTDETLINKKNLVPCVREGKTPQYLKLVLEADEFSSIIKGTEMEYKILKPFGKYTSGMKTFPVDACAKGDELPKLIYEIELPQDMNCRITCHFAPSNPIHKGETQRFGLQWNDEETEILSGVSQSFVGGETGCMEWCRGVLGNEHVVELEKKGCAGRNVITVSPLDPAVVLERMVIRKAE